MPAPLLSPEKVHIAPLDRDGTPLDALARSGPITDTFGATIVIKGQLDAQAEESRARDGLSGAAPETREILTIRVRDAQKAGYEPKMGDRILKVVDRDGYEHTLNRYVQEARRSAKWFGGASTWLLRLTDGAPGKQVDNA